MTFDSKSTKKKTFVEYSTVLKTKILQTLENVSFPSIFVYSFIILTYKQISLQFEKQLCRRLARTH